MTTWREELAWAAGFFDGEGCVCLVGNHARISVNQIDPRALERFKAAVRGVGTIGGPYQTQYNPRWDYRAGGAHKVQAIITMLWEFLGPVKREQALHVLKNMHWEKPKYDPGTPDESKRCRNGHPWLRNKYGQCIECLKVNERRRVERRKKARTIVRKSTIGSHLTTPS